MVVLGREIDTSTTEDVIKLFVNAKDLSNVSKICLKYVLTNNFITSSVVDVSISLPRTTI